MTAVTRAKLEPHTQWRINLRLNRDDQLPELTLMLMRALYVDLQHELGLDDDDAPDLRERHGFPGGFPGDIPWTTPELSTEPENAPPPVDNQASDCG